MQILALDPGTIETGVVVINEQLDVLHCDVTPNEVLLTNLTIDESVTLVTEYMEPRGMPTSKHEMRTLWWIGRFRERWNNRGEYVEITRRQVKMHICGSMKGRDANIRQALIDRYPATGGGATPQIGIKAQKGPLYGMASHCWPALAVGITYLETRRGAGA